MRVLGGLGGILPVAILGVWGTSYVIACLLALSAAGVPIEYLHSTSAGPITLRAETYNFDYRLNILYLDRVTLKEPDGTLLGSVRRVLLHDVVPGRRPIRAEASDLFARLERLPDGKFRFEKYLPPKADPSDSKLPYSVDIKGASILLVDQTTRPEWRRWVSSPRMRMFGAGPVWHAHAPLKIEGSGTTRVKALTDETGLLQVRYSARDFEVARLVELFARTPEGKDVPELKSFAARSALFTGEGKFVIEAEKPIRWQSTGSAHIRGFRYGSDVTSDDIVARGLVTLSGFRGQVRALDPGAAADFDGSWRWGGNQSLAGNLKASVSNPGSLPNVLAKALPKGTTFTNGTFLGWLSYADGFRVSGDATAATVKWDFLNGSQVKARIDSDAKRLLVSELQGISQGSPALGAISYEFANGALGGHVRAKNVNLRETLRRYGLVALGGIADLDAVIFGSVSKPQVVFRASGSGNSTQPGYKMQLGRFDAGGRYFGGQVNLDRFTLVGPAGSTSASGYWNIARDRVSIDLLSTSVPLKAFFDELEGSAAFSGNVAGSSKSLEARGQLEVFGAKVSGQDIQFARGDVVIDRNKMVAENILAFKRGAQAKGKGTLTFKSRALDGAFAVSGIDLSQYPPEGLAGIASISNGIVRGTLDAPTFEADVQADNVAAAGLAVDHLTAKTFVQNGILRVSESRALVAGGVVTGTGTFDMNKRQGTFDALVEAIPIRSLIAANLVDVSVEGLLNGQLRGAFSESKLIALSGKTQVSGLRLNEAFLGSGEVTLDSLDGDNWTGTGFLGDLNAYVQVPQFSYSLATKQLVADVVSDNFEANVIFDAAKRYLVNQDGQSLVPDEMRTHLDGLEGKIDLDAQVTGSLDNLDLALNSFTFDKLAIGGQAAGQIVAKGSRMNRVWTIDQFEWTGGPGALRINKGVIDEHGEATMDGELTNFRWSWLAAFKPELADIAGRSDFSFLVSGPSKSPEIVASLSYDEGAPDALISPWPGSLIRVRDPRSRSRRVDLDSVLIKEGSITAGGVFNLEGFTGTLNANVPFRYPFEIPADEPLSIVAQIPERPLSSLTDLFPWIDPARTDGKFSAGLEFSGTRADVKVGGQFTLGAKTLTPRNGVSGFTDVALLAKFADEKVNISANGTSVKGGTFETEGLGFSLQNLENLFSDSTDVILANRLFGAFRMNALVLEYADPKSGPISATMSGALDLTGTIKRPEVNGTILVNAATLAVPTLESNETLSGEPLINPVFNVSVITSNNLVLKAGTGRFELSGGGKLEGSLASPVFSSTLVVVKGNVRLPNARITIEDGGTILVTYRAAASGTAVSRVEVDLTGRTQVTAQSFTGGVERYDITLSIRGDLLAENGLRLTAQSDPPDLSSDKILAILGQGDVLAGRPGENFRADRQLQSALLGLAIPYIAGSVTEQLASKLGLDYLNIEYNMFDQFSVTAAITLGRDFVLSGRRQLSSPLPGERLKYDVRLSYRPPFRSKTLRRLTFSVGTDQDRPWKFSVEYGIRF